MGKAMHYFCDMDGVLCDLTGPALRVHGREELAAAWPRGTYLLSEALQVSEAELWGPIDACGTSFWAELPRLPWAEGLIGILHRLGEVVIASSPTRSHYSAAGKMLWLERHFGGSVAGPMNFMLGARKELLARPGTVLIDDSDQNVDRFKAAGGNAILVPQPWNRLHDLAAKSEDVLEYLRLQIYRLGA